MIYDFQDLLGNYLKLNYETSREQWSSS